MIKACRIILGDMSYSKCEIYEEHEIPEIPKIFDDGFVCFRCPDGTFITSDYEISLIQLWIGKQSVPDDALFFKRLTVSGENVSQNVYVYPQHRYEEYGIPLIFPLLSQFAFSCKEGMFITSDYNITLAQI